MMYKPDIILRINDSLYYIKHVSLSNIYIIIGTAMAMVLDTGHGYADLRLLIREITDLPYIVVNTHGDIDHCGGNFLFDDVYISAYDYKILPIADDPEMKRMNLEYRANRNPGLEEIIDKNVYMTSSVFETNYHLLYGGEIFDLGDRQLEVISLPGHTPGSICLLDKTNGYLFTGDSIVRNHNVYYMMEYCQPLCVFHSSLKRLWARRNEINLLYPAHAEIGIQPIIIEQTYENIEDIMDNYRNDERVKNHFNWIGYKHFYKDTLIVYSESRLGELLNNGLCKENI